MTKTFKAVLLASIFAVFAIPASAARQERVQAKGKVFDVQGQPLAFATVALMAKDSTIVGGTSTDMEGAYVLEANAGSYTLVASMIGYRDLSLEVVLSAPVTELEEITLEDDSEMLEAAKVTEKVSLVEMKMDKIVMNVSQSAFAQTSNALDLVKKAPGVTIDKDGNIKLNGKSVSIWIDGRPSHMDGKSLENLLRSTSGTSIERFELMPNPSSKYDAQGQGGIINIKTKRNALAGFNGSLGGSAAGMYFKKPDVFEWNEDLWANLNYRGKKTNTFVNLYEGIYNMGMDFSTELELREPDFKQHTESFQNNSYRAFNVKLGNDWFINDKNILGVIATVPGSWNVMGGRKGEEYNGFTDQTLAGETARDLSSSLNNQKNLQGSANINYTHIFDPDRSAELTANLDWYRNASRDNNSIFDRVVLEDESLGDIHEKVVANGSVLDIFSAKLDYQTVVWKNAMLETGAKWALSMTDNKMLKTETGLADNRNDFTYREQVAAAYVSLAKPFFDNKFTVKAGLRGEYTNSFGDWKSTGTSTPRSYFDLFPTVFLGYNHSENLMLNFSYTRRIQRPNYQNLNPAEEYVDAHSLVKGNPDLKPQYTNSVSASVMFFKHFSVAMGYDYTRDMFTQMPEYSVSGEQILTWANFGTNQMAYVNANISAFPIAKWLQWTLNLNALYSDNRNGELRNSNFIFAGYTDFSFILPKDWKIQIDGSYNTPMTWGYFKLSSLWSCNLGVKKTMLDNRLTISLDVDDIFRSSHQNLEIIGGDPNVIRSSITQKYYNQKVKIGVMWNFGQAQRTRYRKVGSLDETSRLGSGSLGGK